MAFDLADLLATRHGEGYALAEQYLNPQLSRTLHAIGFDRAYERAEGAYLYDADGHRYADFLAGFGVFGVGRNHPVVIRALHQMLDAGLADLVQFDCALLPGLLAERLLAKAPGLDRVYFGNSGTEAVEAALKFARYATGRRRIIYCDHAFHGLTTGSLSVNGAAEFRSGFAPLLPDTMIPFGDLDALAAELRKGDVAALLIEPIQGKGVHVVPPGFLAAAATLLHEHGALLICDEVQTGLGRTGRFFGYQHEDVQPDIVTVAKALSGGFVPVGATLAKDWIFQKVYSSMDRVLVHDSTFGSNAAAMAAGLAALSVIDDEDLVGNAERTGAALRDALQLLVDKYEMLTEVRGRGLMIGLEFGRPRGIRPRAAWKALQAARVGLFAQMVVVALFDRHRILTQVPGDHIEAIKLLPPLIIGEAEVELFRDSFQDVMEDAGRGSGLIWDFGQTLIKQAVSARRP
ncbi:MAG TPA: aspartate aminotransferase family protein [Streptosporangiaceae bacterium]|nr:aspartate aminotransferase family protein [Streptosporangiaceae bacterium]